MNTRPGIAIIEVMGCHSGYIALGTAYGHPDLIVVPEHPLEFLVERVKKLYDPQKTASSSAARGWSMRPTRVGNGNRQHRSRS